MRIIIEKRWTGKYKKSIDCNNPKGFSQKAHCAGRKARQSGRDTKSDPVDEEIMQVGFEGELEEQNILIPEDLEEAEPLIVDEKSKLDRCARIAKRKYRVWPSAYASGAAVKCRKGKIWRGVKEEIEEEKEYKPRFDREEKVFTDGSLATVAKDGSTAAQEAPVAARAPMRGASTLPVVRRSHNANQRVVDPFAKRKTPTLFLGRQKSQKRNQSKWTFIT
jgi:hypothetical protein